MRIGIDYTSAVRQGAGIGRYTRELIRALAALDRDNEYTLFVAAGGLPSGGTGQLFPTAQFASSWPPNFRVRSVPLSDHRLAVLWHRLRLPLPVDLVTGSVDLFHSPDFTLPPLLRGRTVLTVHDLSYIRYPETADAGLRAYLNRAVPRSVARADLVLADSRSTRDDLIELFSTDPAKIQVLYPGVESRFHPIVARDLLDRITERYGLHFPFTLSVGTLQPRKNYVRLIEAFGQMKGMADGDTRRGMRLVIVGGKGWLYEEIFARVETLGLADAVLFLGRLPDEDLPALYNLAELFVFPSLYEGFGLPVLEAMACGVPVVCSNASSLPEVVGDAGLMVDPHDVEGLASAMARVIADKALRARMVERGFTRAREFTWTAAAERLLEVYTTIPGLASAGPGG